MCHSPSVNDAAGVLYYLFAVVVGAVLVVCPEFSFDDLVFSHNM